MGIHDLASQKRHGQELYTQCYLASFKLAT
jgi:hypothetical protein